MKIRSATYESLNVEARFRAAIAAIARGDNDEIDQLRKTCPRKPFEITDPGYSERVRGFLTLSSIVELDLRACALDYFTAVVAERKTGPPTRSEDDKQEIALVKICSIAVAWRRFLDGLGIDHDDAAKAGLPTHSAVIVLTKDAEANADEDRVETLQELYNRFFTDHAAS